MQFEGVDNVKLSICMMIKNEEENLHRCLKQLKPMVEAGMAELIIVDTGSEDRSVEISKEYTDKIYFHKWNNNFSEMRNKSISYAKGEWIFIIDADERLDDVEKLITLINSADIKKCKTVLLQVKNLYDVEDESKYNLIISPRIFKNNGKFRYEGAVHNQPIFSAPNLSVDISLTHFGYISTDKELMEKKFKRTAELLKNELKKEPRNLYYIYQLGISYDMHGDHKDSLREFRKAYDILKTKSLEEKKMYAYIYGSHARIAYTNNELRETIKIAKEALILEKDYVDLYYLLGISEKQLKNNEEAFKYLSKYIELLGRYNELDISKDMTIIMYHSDEKSKSTAYFQIVQYYLELEKYKDAYKIYKNVTNINEKIYISINTLIPLEKYSELKEVCEDIDREEDRNNFIYTLEDKAKKLKDSEKNNLYKVFSLNNDIYGVLNKIRIAPDVKEKLRLTKLLIEKIDFNKQPIFYSEIFENIKEDKKLLMNTLNKIEVWNLKEIVKYLIIEKEFTEFFEEYLLRDCADIKNYMDAKEIGNVTDIEELKVAICITTVLLAVYLKDNNEVSKKYSEIFKLYIDMGIEFVKVLYRIEKAATIYKSISNQQDRFFVIMYIFNKLMEENNKKSAVKYMIEAVYNNEAFSKYIDIYKDEILNLEEEQIMKEKNKEFADYKAMVKENINSLINNGELEEAKILINQYEEVINNDIDMYSVKSIIAMMEGNVNEAEKILKDGLRINSLNSDLLFNLSYVQSQKNNSVSAVENYSKAKLFTPNNNVKVSDIITNLKPMDNNNLRILNGTIEIANQMSTITKGLKKLGLDAKSLNYYPNYLGYKSDYVLDLNSLKDKNELNIQTKKMAAKMIAENDIFHFHFGTTLTLDYSDVPLIKELGKKIFMQYWGSDVRMYSKAKELSRFVKVKDMNEEGIKQKLDFLGKHITDCIVSDYELYEYVKDKHDKVHLVLQAIDLTKYKMSKAKNNKLLIVHAPSSPEIKGTEYILKAVENLKDKYDFNFTLVQGMAHEEAKKVYAKADLVIDQILCGSYGLFAIEAMAMGKPVITWISEFMEGKYPKTLPIISANPENIEAKLEYLINNREQLSELGRQGREYVEEYHDKDKIAKQLLEIYKS